VTNAGGISNGNDETYTKYSVGHFTASLLSASATSASVSVGLKINLPKATPATIELAYGTGTSRDLHASVSVTLPPGDHDTASTVTLTGLTPATLYTADPSAVINISTPSGSEQQTLTPEVEDPSIDPLILTAAAGVSNPSPVSNGKTTQVVTCDSGTTCTGSFVLVPNTVLSPADDDAHAAVEDRAHASPATIAHVKFTARRGKKTKVVIKLSKSARRTLDKKHKLKVIETIRIKGPHGMTKTRRALTLRGH
jgi:hypothetical protein